MLKMDQILNVKYYLASIVSYYDILIFTTSQSIMLKY